MMTTAITTIQKGAADMDVYRVNRDMYETAQPGDIPVVASGNTAAEALANLVDELTEYLDTPHLMDPPPDEPDRRFTRSEIAAAIDTVHSYAAAHAISLACARHERDERELRDLANLPS